MLLNFSLFTGVIQGCATKHLSAVVLNTTSVVLNTTSVELNTPIYAFVVKNIGIPYNMDKAQMLIFL